MLLNIYGFSAIFITIFIVVYQVEGLCNPICDLACYDPPSNCTRTGGAIKAMSCACCDTCVYTVGKNNAFYIFIEI